MGTDSSGLPLCEPGSRGRLGFLFQLLEVSAIFGLFVSQSFCVRPGLSRRKVFLCFFLIYCFLYFVHTQHKPVWSMPPCAAARGRGGGAGVRGALRLVPAPAGRGSVRGVYLRAVTAQPLNIKTRVYIARSYYIT